jgi:WD repeat-containing protein 35
VKTKDYITVYDQKQLKDLQENLTKMTPKNVGYINKAFEEIKNTSQAKVWQILTEHALEQLDFETAEKALIKQKNYSGLQMIKRVQIIDDSNI